MSLTMTESAAPASEATAPVLQAADFLLGPEDFVSRCVEAHDGAADMLTAPQRAALAEAIRAGRSRVEIVAAVRCYSALGGSSVLRMTATGNPLDFGNYIVTDRLIQFAEGDDVAFVDQVYKQALNRSPTSLEAIEAKFDLKAGLSRIDFIERIARRSPVCRLDTDALPVGLGSTVSADGKICFNLVEPTRSGGWNVAPDVLLQPAPTVDGFLELETGWVLMGPKASFPAGKWLLAIDLVQPELACLNVDIVANAGIDVLASLDLIGPARLAVGFSIQPWHHFVELRMRKGDEEEHLRKLKLRELVLKQA